MRIRALGPWVLVLAASLTSPGCKRGSDEETTSPAVLGAAQPTALPRIDGERMHGILATLAGDGLGGRYTLSPEDIGRAADFLAAQYREAGIEPVGDAFRHDFPIVTGVELGETQGVRVVAGSKQTPLQADVFTPLPVSGSTTARAQVVFVGYAARAEAAGDRPPYDDLAGVDLQGKIALVLTDLPGQPSARRLAGHVRELVRDAERTAASLRASQDLRALTKLHVDTRTRVAKLVSPYLRGQALPADFVAPPEDPMGPLSTGALLGPLVETLRARPGPSFGYAEGRLRTKLDRLRDAGVSGVIVVRSTQSFFDAPSRAEDELPKPDEARPGTESYAFPVVQVRWKAADRSLRVGGKTLSALQKKIDGELVPRSAAAGLEVELQTQVEPIVASVPNVLATMPGTDLAHEVVILGAHYDHIGTDAEGRGHCQAVTREDGTPNAICNGADDNASGTAMVVELARALTEAGVKPRRTLVFAHFAGEEIGLLGSKALADHPPAMPPFSDGRIVAMLNLDMIGRLSDQGLAIGGTSSSPGWMPLLERIGTHDMPIIYDRAVSSRSDHASFYKHDIPVLFFFTHLHGDYHQPGDEVQHINRDGMVQIANLVGDLLVAVADGHDLPFSAPRTPEEGLVGALPGANPATLEPASTQAGD
jgi:hypothetical protein